MSLFKKKPTIPEGLTNALLPGGRTVDVVGESHYQEALELITGGKTEEAHDLEKWASLIREADNPYDRNAVAVYIDGRKVGYLSRDDAPQYGVLLDELWQKYHLRGACRANICGGWRRFDPTGSNVTDEGHYGVKLALAAPEDLLGAYEITACDDEKLREGPPPRDGGDASSARAEVATRAGGMCVLCQSELREGAKFCGVCGAPVPAQSAGTGTCPGCGRPAVAGDKFCRECGHTLA